LPRSIPIRCIGGEDRFVGDLRRLQFEDLGGVGEELAGRHRVDLDLRRGLHVDAGIDGADRRLDGLTTEKIRLSFRGGPQGRTRNP
jgi:hypothetical protein